MVCLLFSLILALTTQALSMQHLMLQPRDREVSGARGLQRIQDSLHNDTGLLACVHWDAFTASRSWLEVYSLPGFAILAVTADLFKFACLPSPFW